MGVGGVSWCHRAEAGGGRIGRCGNKAQSGVEGFLIENGPGGSGGRGVVVEA